MHTTLKRYSLLTAIIVVVSMASCKKEFLEKTVDDTQSLQETFADIKMVRNWVNGLYNTRLNELTLLGNSGFSAGSDEAIHGNTANNSQLFFSPSWSSVNSPIDIWNTHWSVIRNCNTFFENKQFTPLFRGTDSLRVLDEQNVTGHFLMQRLTGEVYFLRAYYYMQLMKFYGGVPIIPKAFLPTDDFNRPRNSVDEVVSFISNDLDSAMNYLPDSYSDYSSWYGRAPTRAMAMAYKGRLLLYYASPLNNPGNDASRWKKAADLLGSFITKYSPSLFDLEPKVQDCFFNPNSKEVIFSILNTAGSNTIDKVQRPVGFKFTGGPAINPSQNLVDAFQMANGKDISDPSYNPNDPYTGRDPRFRQFILFNGTTLPDNPSGSNWTNRQVETFVGGKDASAVVNGTRSGYYLRKFMDTALNLVSNQASFRNYVLMRYAEVLLNYAEAANEAYGPYSASLTCDLTAAQAVEKIRQRAGLSPYQLPAEFTKDQMREAVIQERRIELCFENHRFWDVRRWKKGKELFGQPLKGVVITRSGTSPDFTYEYSYPTIQERTYLEKSDVFPIPNNELIANPNMTQNKDW